jgi:hypothetical protein
MICQHKHFFAKCQTYHFRDVYSKLPAALLYYLFVQLIGKFFLLIFANLSLLAQRVVHLFM